MWWPSINLCLILIVMVSLPATIASFWDLPSLMNAGQSVNERQDEGQSVNERQDEGQSVNERQDKDDLSNECDSALGMESRIIPDSKIRASSEFSHSYRAANARLNLLAGPGRKGGWSADTNDKNQWLQTDFGTVLKVTKIATQGHSDDKEWVTKYTISYSTDGIFWNKCKKEFEGNRDQSSKVINALGEEILARFVRVHPIAWQTHISMRVEFYGCKSAFKEPTIRCRRPLGMESKKIPDSRLTASSIWDSNHGPERARLNTVRQGNKRGAWSARLNNLGQWIELDFAKAVKIKGIATQGRQDVDQWVTSYKLQYSLNGDYFEDYNSGQKILGNVDRNTIVGHNLEPPIVAKAIRILPLSWYGHISMRFELYGCLQGFSLPRKPNCSEDLLKLTNSQLSSSSQWDNNHGPGNAKLHHQPGGGKTGAWSSGYNDAKQWLQVDLGEISKITIISTQGRADHPQWVKSYSIAYSVLGSYYLNMMDGNSIKVFAGNTDQHAIVSHRLESPIIALYIRFNPKSWHGHISMRVGLFGCRKGFDIPKYKCGLALGMESGMVLDSQISASSEWNSAHRAANARLNFVPGSGRTGAWSARHNNLKQWLQIDFGRIAKIIKCATQGRSDYDQWVTKYTLSYSRDGIFWAKYHKVFEGNSNRSLAVTHGLMPHIYSRFVRVHPIAWHHHISMRVEFYGCKLGFKAPPVIQCRRPLGMENKKILDSRLTASSIWDSNHGPGRARLNTARQGNKRGAWSTRYNSAGHWIKADFPEFVKFTGIATQGRQDVSQWVKLYKLQYSLNGDYFEDYNGGKTFTGNSDRNTIIGHLLEPPIVAKAIRLHPLDWQGHISMRFELYGCSQGFAAPRQSNCSTDLLLKDSQLSFSSKLDKNQAPDNAKLYHQPALGKIGSWSSGDNNGRQWLQVDLVEISKITIISTQGRADHPQWVKSYFIEYSLFRDTLSTVMDGVSHKEFSGNFDQHTVVSQKLDSPIIAQYIRFRPTSWHVHISMRVGLFGCRKGFDVPKHKCGLALGLESGIVPDSQFSASSEFDSAHRAANARLNSVSILGRVGAWSPWPSNQKQWLQIYFGGISKINKVASQGSSESNQWVTRFTISYSKDGIFWDQYQKEFEGNRDSSTVITHTLLPIIYARFVRIHPIAWHNRISMRVELYGCKSGFKVPPIQCRSPLGMESKKIPDSHMSASSIWDSNHGAERSRLNTVRQGNKRGAWSAKYNNINQWIKVDFPKAVSITGIATQGRQDVNQWVKSYKLQYSINGHYFEDYNVGNTTFTGNTDRNTIVGHLLDPAIIAKVIRIRPTSWQGHISMRLELYGCEEDTIAGL